MCWVKLRFCCGFGEKALLMRPVVGYGGYRCAVAELYCGQCRLFIGRSKIWLVSLFGRLQHMVGYFTWLVIWLLICVYPEIHWCTARSPFSGCQGEGRPSHRKYWLATLSLVALAVIPRPRECEPLSSGRLEP